MCVYRKFVIALKKFVVKDCKIAAIIFTKGWNGRVDIFEVNYY